MNELSEVACEQAIEAVHGTRSRLIRREYFAEKLAGETVWRGEVLVFELLDHATAQVCYCWEVNGELTLVLGKGSVTSARGAVRTWLNHDPGGGPKPE